MEKRVLVLNLDHSPVAVVTVQKALVLAFLEKVSCLRYYDALKVRTVTREFSYPAVVRLNEYKPIPFKGVMLNRNNLFRRDGHECQYCGSRKHLTIDHVIPRSKGGQTSWTNLITACNPCNVQKGSRTPEQAGMPLRKHPYRPSLSHFLAEYAEKHAEEWMPFLGVKAV